MVQIALILFLSQISEIDAVNALNFPVFLFSHFSLKKTLENFIVFCQINEQFLIDVVYFSHCSPEWLWNWFRFWCIVLWLFPPFSSDLPAFSHAKFNAIHSWPFININYVEWFYTILLPFISSPPIQLNSIKFDCIEGNCFCWIELSLFLGHFMGHQLWWSLQWLRLIDLWPLHVTGNDLLAKFCFGHLDWFCLLHNLHKFTRNINNI